MILDENLSDGTTFRLSFKPARADAADYSGRKGGYTITNLFFSNLNRKIRYYVTGWAGCAHDNRMWVNSSIHLRPMEFMAPNEYIIGDSAFANGPHMVTTYKAPTGGLLQGSKKRFNDVLLSPRVILEHLNGILKGRWCWLKGIPNILNEDIESMRRILRLIDVTVILHNFLMEHKFTKDESFFFNDSAQTNDDDESELDEDSIYGDALEDIPRDAAFCGIRHRQQDYISRDVRKFLASFCRSGRCLGSMIGPLSCAWCIEWGGCRTPVSPVVYGCCLLAGKGFSPLIWKGFHLTGLNS